MNSEEKAVVPVEEKKLVIDIRVKDAVSGLPENKIAQLQKVLIPMFDKLDEFESEYNGILERPMDEEASKDARELRLKMVKIRTGTEKIRKEQKKEFVLAGKAVDGIAALVTHQVSSKESKLQEIEDYFENQEKERKSKLAEIRIEELKDYDCDGSALGLGEMSEEIYKSFLTGTKTNYETAQKAETDRIERERVAEEERVERNRKIQLNTDRRIQCSKLVDYIPEFATRDLSDLTKEEYSTLTTEAIRLRKIEEDKQEAIRLENVRLKEEADKKERLRVKQEADRKAKEKRDKKAREDKEEKARKEREDEKEKTRKSNQAKLDKEKKIADDKLKKEREEAEAKRIEDKRIADEKIEVERKKQLKLQKKIDADKALADKIKLEEENRLRDAELAPDKEKVLAFLINMESLREKIDNVSLGKALQEAYDIIDVALRDIK